MKLHKVSTSLEGTFHQQLKTGTTGINEFDTYSIKKTIYRRNTKCTTGRKAISVCKIAPKNTHNEEILSTVKRYQIPFTNLPVQEESPNKIKRSEQQSLVVDQEIPDLLEKRAIQKADAAQEEFLSNLFLEGKNVGGGGQSCDKSEKTQYVHPLREVQNRFGLTETSYGKKTIYCVR